MTHAEVTDHTSVPGATQQLANFANRVALSDVPDDVVSKLKMLILDQLGAEVSCMDLPWTQSIKRYAERYSRKGEAIVMISGEPLDAEYAALVNGTAGHGFEIDDYTPAPTHIGCVAVPASIAVALEQQSTGEELLLALLAAFEIHARIAYATMPSMIVDRGFHATCVHGVFGSAAAASRLMKLSERETLMALSIAGSHASGTTEFSQSGGDIKRFHAGMGAAGGIRSARSAACGMTGPGTILEGRRGTLQAFSAHPNPNALLDGLWKKWLLMETEVKPYTCCGLVISQVEGLRNLVKEHDIKNADIEKIVVGADQFSLVHVGSIGPQPKTIIEAQFSTHFSLAMTLVLGANDFSSYHAMAGGNFQHPGVCEMARRVEVIFDPQLQARFPDISKSNVTISTKDGRTLRGDGFGYRKLSKEEVEKKFLGLVNGVLTTEQASGIIDAVANMEKIGNATELVQLLVRKKNIVRKSKKR